MSPALVLAARPLPFRKVSSTLMGSREPWGFPGALELRLGLTDKEELSEVVEEDEGVHQGGTLGHAGPAGPGPWSRAHAGLCVLTGVVSLVSITLEDRFLPCFKP